MWLRLADVLRVKILVQQRSLSIIKACNHLHEAWSLPHADFWFVQIKKAQHHAALYICITPSGRFSGSSAISGDFRPKRQMFSERIFLLFCSDFWRILGGRFTFRSTTKWGQYSRYLPIFRENLSNIQDQYLGSSKSIF